MFRNVNDGSFAPMSIEMLPQKEFMEISRCDKCKCERKEIYLSFERLKKGPNELGIRKSDNTNKTEQ
ncbi:hypothetical protein QQP08_026637 [Theobroma cacao]|nr:hypothetical protein QQP08_026637 [Theobroma cacao]